MLLAETLKSSTFKLALIAIGAFGVIVSAVFVYVYLSTSAYVRSRSDREIMWFPNCDENITGCTTSWRQ